MKTLIMMLAAFAVGFTGCTGERWSGSDPGATGPLIVVKTSFVESDACPYGGVTIEQGFDENGNGALDATEITKTESVCNGAPGTGGTKGGTGAGGESGAAGDEGGKGDTGATGDTGAPGDPGIACWDDNGNGTCDLPAEDHNGDNDCTPADCFGPSSIQCWDKNGDGICNLPDEDGNNDGSCSVVDCRGADGVSGFSCWDVNNNHACDLVTEDANSDGSCTVADCNGGPGIVGAAGYSCWDLNGDYVCNAFDEDKNGDGNCTTADCRGPEGSQGTTGVAGLQCWDVNANGACDKATEDVDGSGACEVSDCTGTSGGRGISCWDLNANRICDPSEDTNGDGSCTAADCAGLVGLMNVVDEPAGASCLYGGKKVESGQDQDRDGILDPPEVSDVDFVCNGADGNTPIVFYTVTTASVPPEAESPPYVSPGTNMYLAGRTVNVYAYGGNSGWLFDHWENEAGTNLGSDDSIEITMTGNRTIRAFYKKVEMAWRQELVYQPIENDNFYRRFSGPGYEIVPHAGKILAIGVQDPNSTTVSVWQSTDGLNWDLLTANPAFGWREYHAALSFNGRLWVIGGWAGDSMQRYVSDVWSSGDGVTWVKETDAPFAPRGEMGAVVFDSHIWVIGGGDYQFFRSDVWKSADGKNWTRVGKAPFAPRWHHRCAVHDGKIWMVGGQTGTPGGTTTNVKDVWWSADGTNWTQATAAAPFTSGNDFALISLGGKLWKVGEGSYGEVYSTTDGATWTDEGDFRDVGGDTNVTGAAFDGGGGERMWIYGSDYDIVYAANSADGVVWQHPYNRFDPRYLHQAVVFNGKFFVIGGYGDFWNDPLDDVWSSTDGAFWSQVPATNRFSARFGHSALVLDGKLWVIGGSDDLDNSDEVWSSPDGVTWTDAGAAGHFTPRWGHSSVVFDNKMWVIGGYDDPTGYLNDVWYSADGTVWTNATAAAQFTPRYNHASVVFDNKIWVIGGYDGSDPYKNDVWYSSDGITWTDAGAAGHFSARYGHTALVHDGKMWVIAGGGATGSMRDVWSSTNGKDWTQATSEAAFDSRSYSAGVVLNGRMWLISGTNDDSDVWHSADGVKWRPARSMLHFTGRMNLSLTTFDSKLWLIGGRDQADVFAEVWNSPDGHSWTLKTDAAPFGPRAEHAAIAFGDNLFVIGGTNGGAYQSDVWAYDKGSGLWGQKTASAGFAPRGGAAVVEWNGRIYLSGGCDDIQCYGDIWSSADGVTWTQTNTSGTTFAARGYHAMTVFKGSLWVLGGRTPAYSWSYDIWSSADGATWERNSETLYSHDDVQAFVTGGHLVVVHDDETMVTKDGMWWTWLPDVDFLWDPGRASTIFGGRLWLLGGGDGSYDFTNEMWSGSLSVQ